MNVPTESSVNTSVTMLPSSSIATSDQAPPRMMGGWSRLPRMRPSARWILRRILRRIDRLRRIGRRREISAPALLRGPQDVAGLLRRHFPAAVKSDPPGLRVRRRADVELHPLLEEPRAFSPEIRQPRP